MNANSRSNGLNRREFLANSAGALMAGAVAAHPFISSSEAREFPEPTRTAAASPPHRIILDTDPGVDDAMAILLALRSPELNVEAVTPVAGNVPLEFTLPNALRLLELAGRTDIPVAAGASAPLVRRLVTAKSVHGENGLGGVEFPPLKTKPVAETATEIIRRIVRANPGEISIVAIGPLTNVATALRADPELARMIRSIAIMGGSLSGGNVTPAAEFNLYVDPEAARIVFDAGVPLTMVGLDVTRKVLLGEDHLKVLEATKTPVSQTAARIMRNTMERMKQYRRNQQMVAMHDPLTVAHLIDPGILSLKEYYVQVETSGELTAGETLGYEGTPVFRSAPLDTGAAGEWVGEPFRPNATVAVGVNAERFFRLLLGRLTAPA